VAQLVDLTSLTDSDIAAWRALVAEAVEPNPFFEPEYCLPLARATGQTDRVSLIIERDGPQWTACLPVIRDKGWHRAPLPHLSTWRAHNLYALLGTPLLVPGAGLDGVVGVLADAKRTALVGVDWLLDGGPVHAAMTAAIAARGLQPIEYERFERAALYRHLENDYAETTVSSKHRREYRRQRRRLGDELGDVEVRDRAGDPAAIDELIACEARQPLAARGQVLAANPQEAAFFREMCASFAAQGRLQVLELRAGDRALAYKCNVIAADGIFTLKIAFEQDFKAYSPGIQLELEMLNVFHETPTLSWMDSCADTGNAMINRLWPDRRTLVSVVLPTSPIAGPAVRGLQAYRNRKTGASK
jgi:CelD/BcsL family acetyltransferase involved in cellulose biosynthesis